jgi:hypothetical protein
MKQFQTSGRREGYVLDPKDTSQMALRTEKERSHERREGAVPGHPLSQILARKPQFGTAKLLRGPEGVLVA